MCLRRPRLNQRAVQPNRPSMGCQWRNIWRCTASCYEHSLGRHWAALVQRCCHPTHSRLAQVHRCHLLAGGWCTAHLLWGRQSKWWLWNGCKEHKCVTSACPRHQRWDVGLWVHWDFKLHDHSDLYLAHWDTVRVALALYSKDLVVWEAD